MGKCKSLTSDIIHKTVLMAQDVLSRNVIARQLHISKMAINNAVLKYRTHGTFGDLIKVEEVEGPERHQSGIIFELKEHVRLIPQSLIDL